MAVNTKLEYGEVFIVGGKHRGRVAFYKDDVKSKCLVEFSATEKDLIAEVHLKNFGSPKHLEELKAALAEKVKR